MNTHSLLRHLLCDMQSLNRYHTQHPVSVKDIERNLLLLERQHDTHIPDHYYRLALNKTFSSLDDQEPTLPGPKSRLFTNGLVALADEYLEIRDGRLYVKAHRFNEWQSLVSYMPPLILIAARLWKEHKIDTTRNLTHYLHKYIVPNTRFTALISPYIPQLEILKQDRNGLQDLHIHLNGALETDMVWQDLLTNPQEVYMELKNANSFNDDYVKELCQQIAPWMDSPEKFVRLMQTAAKIRALIYHLVSEDYKNDTNSTLSELLQRLNSDIAAGHANMYPYLYPTRKHPMTLWLGECSGPMQYECLLYILIFTKLQEGKSEHLADSFHHYLLILGFANMLLVQHRQHYGFQEFQKYTKTGVREFSERRYRRRFMQMAGNNLDHLRFLEGRFSPKQSIHENERILNFIYDGWHCMEHICIQDNKSIPELKLIAHFIKKEDKNFSKKDNQQKQSLIRHKKLRKQVYQCAMVLSEMKRNKNPYTTRLTGIDAAGSEFDTPPEVFAVAYRKLRENGFSHFTYHAGEDFYHILGGLRAIFEAVEFLGLKSGDRIGHATASGVSVALWRSNIGDKILLKQGEYLDDLIFARHLIIENNIEELYHFIPLLNDKISSISNKVYNHDYGPDLLTEAWLMRGTDPQSVINKYVNNKNQSAREPLTEAEKIFLQYHNNNKDENKNEYEKVKEYDTYDILGEKELVRLQLALLEWLHKRVIVIETLPTSNVVIGHHHNFITYHLNNWLQWRREGHPIPPIVVGTDDVGIFATNIYNEYCNIYCDLLYNKKMNESDILQFIKELDDNARIYRFN